MGETGHHDNVAVWLKRGCSVDDILSMPIYNE